MGVYIKNWSLADWKELLKLAKIGANNAMIGEFTEVEELPPHGDLIDRDALLNRDADYEYPLFDTDGSWDCVVPCYDRETIKSAPTVIEAEA